jgi:hypothetical protein
MWRTAKSTGQQWENSHLAIKPTVTMFFPLDFQKINKTLNGS